MSAVLGRGARFPSPISDTRGRAPNYLGYFLVASALLHALLLLLHFNDALNKHDDRGNTALQVVLVNSKSAQRPVKADALAQANLDGGGNTDAQAVATTPFPALQDREPQPELKARLKQVEEKELEQARLLSQIKARPELAQPAPPAPAEAASGRTPDAAEIRARGLQIARLDAQVEREHRAYQSRPKRVNIGARTREYRFAQYIDNWRLKVERIGNLNYPDEARQKKLYGSLRITVNLNSDGSLDSIDIDQTSGSRILDEAALRIIKLGAPYAPFPDNIRKDADILGITRTWFFTRSDQLASE